MHQQVNALNIEQLLIAQEFISALSAEKIKVIQPASPQPYLEVRAIFSVLRSSLSQDILRERDDRV